MIGRTRCFGPTGSGAAAGRGGRRAAEAAAGEGHDGGQTQENRRGRDGAGRPEQQTLQGLSAGVIVLRFCENAGCFSHGLFGGGCAGEETYGGTYL